MTQTSTADTSETASFLSFHSDTHHSPINGYFSSLPSIPRDMYIDTDAANRDSKAQHRVKIHEDAPGSAGRHSQENTPLLESFHTQAPPPTYLEATTPNPWGPPNARPSGDENARLLSFDGRIDPEALADPLDGQYDGPSFQRRRRSFKEHCSRKRMLKWMLAILLIIIIAAIIAALIGRGDKNTISKPLPAQPVKPGTPASSQKDYPIHWPSSCGRDYNINSKMFDVDSPSTYSVTEGVAQWSGPYKRISGWVHVAPAAADQSVALRVKLAYAASSSVDMSSIKYSTTPDSLLVGEPSDVIGMNGVQSGTACLGISIVLYVKAGLELENLNIAATHLGMQIHGGTSMHVTNTTSISLTTGTLDASSLESRTTRLRTIAGSISGKYALYDLLDIDTKSGSININIDPKDLPDGETDKGARFNVKSLSGSVRADYETAKIPSRDYQAMIETKVGSVDGRFLHGSKTSVQTLAGYINLDLIPFLAKDATSTLDTYSSSGRTDIKLRAPFGSSAGGMMTKLKSSHKSVSGAVDLTYPQDWEGHLDGTSLSGGLHLQGQDLELLKETNEPGKSHVEAKKGNGQSDMVINTISGECDVKVGKLGKE